MAPINQEEKLKAKLEKRSIQPSSESWLTLAKRLEVEEKKKKQTSFWWYGVAASVVGILFVTTIYFNNSEVKNSVPEVVDSKEIKMPLNNHDMIDDKSQSNEVALEKVSPSDKNANESIEKSTIKTMASDKKTMITELPEENVIAEVEKTTGQNPEEVAAKTKKATLTFEEQKIQQVVAEIMDLNSKGTAVTDAEIDTLLKKAQKEILSNKLFNENTRTVDANALLQDVEDDLQRSFRSKVLEALQSGYESVKTAVAERNN